MEYYFPAFYYSSTFGDVQMFPLQEGTHTHTHIQKSRKRKQKCWPGACSPLPALPNISKWRWQLSVFCWLFKCISKCQGADATFFPLNEQNGSKKEERRGAPGEASAPTRISPLETPMPGFALHLLAHLTLSVVFSI